MIRDPSDGSVREEIVHDAPISPGETDSGSLSSGGNKAATPECVPRPDAGTAHMISGLPDDSTKPKDLARLQKSREWLKQYLKRGI